MLLIYQLGKYILTNTEWAIHIEPYLRNHEAEKEIPHLSFPQFLHRSAS